MRVEPFDEISVLIRRRDQSMLSAPYSTAVKTQQEALVCSQEEGCHQELNLLASRTLRNKVLLFKPPS